MKQIALATSHNGDFTTELQNSGYSVIEYSPVRSIEDVSRINNHTSHYLILEIEDSTVNLITGLHTAQKTIICLTQLLTAKTRKALFKKGIANLLQTETPERLINYITILESRKKPAIASILIIEDNPSIKTILQEIIERFNFKPLFINSEENISDCVQDNNDIQLLLVNLGHKRLNIKKLIMKSLSTIEIRKIPIIAYKDMDTGLFVHELISGLNKLTKYILSIDELFSLLLEMLFNKELYPLILKLNKKTDYQKNEAYAKNMLNHIIRQDEYLFKEITLLDDKHLIELLKLISEIKKTSLKADGLTWLRMNYKPSQDFTCEVGV